MLTDLTDNQVRVCIRWGIRRDMASLLWIDSGSFEEPWTERDFTRRLAQRSIILMVAEVGEEVVGFVVYELHEDRLHLLRLAVSPERRRQGVGMQMIAKLVGKLHGHRRDRLTLDVPEECLSAQLWLRALGVRAVSVDHDAETIRFEWRKD